MLNRVITVASTLTSRIPGKAGVWRGVWSRYGIRIFGTVWLLVFTLPVRGDKLQFNRDIRPVLSDACFRCHGFDAATRKGGVRLDLRDDALKPGKSGATPIVPGKPDQSEVVRRLYAPDPDELMPPRESHKRLTAEQKATIRNWIQEGAVYEGHWAFQPIARPEIPWAGQARDAPLGHQPIDAFVSATLRAKGLPLAGRTDRTTLIRRVSLDLTGMPPAPEAVAAFEVDERDDAYERVVDRLLRSPRYGERMAQDWLDAARFADSNGYQVDRDREAWAWRDWVVGAFNRNLSFDQFTVEQLAGDLLPGATFEQRIATGFHRNHMSNEEGGIIPEEFLAEYCADRVETTATVWLGLTFNCARCHDHKYDPFTQRDFYGLYAFFHNITEKGVGDYGSHYRRSTPPWMLLPAPELETALGRLNQDLSDESAVLTNLASQVLLNAADWERQVTNAHVTWQKPWLLHPHVSSNGVTEVGLESVLNLRSLDTNLVVFSATLRIPLSSVSALRFELSRNHSEVAGSTNRIGVRELRVWRVDGPLTETNALAVRPRSIETGAPTDDVAKALDGKTNTSWQAVFTTNGAVVACVDFLRPLPGSGQVLLKIELEASASETNWPWRLAVEATSTPLDWLATPEVRGILLKPVVDRKDEDQKKLGAFRLAQSPVYEAQRLRVEGVRGRAKEKENALPVTLVMQEMDQPRETFVLMRGAYDRKGERVMPSTPGMLPAFSSELPRNRLGLARWLTSSSNPLTARVMVNRLWQSFFGVGLVRTAEDFGVQGEAPSHPELLDWLARSWMERGWDIKWLVKEMVTSETYQRASKFSKESATIDPENRWLARGPRFRLSGEAIRDQALSVSGLMVGQFGGPAVRPYHPSGIYEQVVAGSSADTYVQDKGANLYRRSLYTYWKRSVPNPSLLLFDRPFRETCAVRRARTSTPLQALNLLNDPTYVEASRALAQRMIREGGLTEERRVRHGFRLVTCRQPNPAELRILIQGLRRAAASFAADYAAAEALVKVGDSVRATNLDLVELAAYTSVASTLLNLDETLTKE